MRHIDDIIKAVNEHPHLSSVEKIVLERRIEKRPTPEELAEARDRLDETHHVGWTDENSGRRYLDAHPR